MEEEGEDVPGVGERPEGSVNANDPGVIVVAFHLAPLAI